MTHLIWKLKGLSFCTLILSIANIGTTAAYFASLQKTNTSTFLFNQQSLGFHLAVFTLIIDCFIVISCIIQCWVYHCQSQNYTYIWRLIFGQSFLMGLKLISGISSHIQDECTFPKNQIKSDCSSNSQNSNHSCNLLATRTAFIVLIYITIALGCSAVILLRYYNKFLDFPNSNMIILPSKIISPHDAIIDLQKPLQSVYNEFQIRKYNPNDNSILNKSIKKVNSQNFISNSMIKTESKRQNQDLDLSIQRQLEQINKFVGETVYQQTNMNQDQNSFVSSSLFMHGSGPRANRAYGIDAPTQLEELDKYKSEESQKNQILSQSFTNKANNTNIAQLSKKFKERIPLQSQSSMTSKISNYDNSWVNQCSFASNTSSSSFNYAAQGLNFSQQLSQSKRGSNLSIFKGQDCPPSPIRRSNTQQMTFNSVLKKTDKHTQKNANDQEQSDCFDESTNEQIHQDQAKIIISPVNLNLSILRSKSLQANYLQRDDNIQISEEPFEEDQKDQSSAFENSQIEIQDKIITFPQS